jgi:hypothetical protein
MWRLIDRIPWLPLVLGAVLLGLAPFVPEPHLVEKLRMLLHGQLERPIDVFDLVLHAALPALLLLKAGRFLLLRRSGPPHGGAGE